MILRILSLSFFCALLLLRSIPADAVEMELLFTGETHAALEPCDCPIEPYGGIMRRAAAVKQERQEHPDLLLLDAGGAFAGGMYDESTEGKERDRTSTEIYLEAMRMMGYTAMVAGDEEFYYGREFLLQQSLQLPILSANTFFEVSGDERSTPTSAERQDMALSRGGQRRLLSPYSIREVDGIRIGIVGLTTPETAQFRMEGIEFRDPVASLREILPELQADIIVVLAHLGEKASRKLIEDVPGIHILINGHRKQSRQPFEMLGETIWLQFNYQGQKLGKLVFEFTDGRIQHPQFEQIPLDASIPDDPEVAALVREYQRASAQPAQLRLDLYVMSLCPYAPAAERAVAEVVQRFKTRLDWNLYFILQEQDGHLVSLRGAEELQENRIQVAIAKYYPEKLWQYLQWRNESIRGTPWQEGARQLGLHLTRLEMAVRSGQVDQILRDHAWRTERLGVVDSPTIFINNQLYAGPMKTDALMRALCAKLGETNQATPCEALPECIVDTDCQREGFIGVCANAGTPKADCKYEKAVKIPLTVIRDPEAYLSNEEDIIRSTRTMFPGVQITLVDAQTQEGADLIQQYALERLPAYLFGPEILKARHLSRIKSDLRRVQHRYLANPISVGSPMWIKRHRKPYRLDLFIQPLSPNAIRAWIALQHSLRNTSWQPHLRYLLEYRAAREEAARQIVIRSYYPEKFQDYLTARLETLDSSYWEDTLVAVGLDPLTIKQMAREHGMRLLEEDRQWAEAMALGGELALTVENRETVVLRNAAQLKSLIQRIAGVSYRMP